MTKILNDQNIINCLSNKSEEFWDFKTGFEKVHVHGIAKYPATMVPKMQAELMDILLNNASISSMLDPFMGSGTSVVLGLDRGLETYGFDINPLAYLITNVKSTRYDLQKLNVDFNMIIKAMDQNRDDELFEFDGIQKWFKEDIIKDLSFIRSSILDCKFEYVDFIALAFAETIKAATNSRTSTSKLHIKTRESIDEFELDCKAFFVNKLENMIDAIHDYHEEEFYRDDVKCSLRCGNSYDLLDAFDRKVDLIITSPPYGDNATTVSYGQFSVLQLRWLEGIVDVVDNSSTETLVGIDSKSLGGVKSYSTGDTSTDLLMNKSPSFETVMKALEIKDNKQKIRKVKLFYSDLSSLIIKLYDQLNDNGYALFTTGNRVVDGIQIPLDEILIELSEAYGMKKIYRFERNILKKRYPSKVSIDGKNRKVKSIDRETVILLKKKGDA